MHDNALDLDQAAHDLAHLSGIDIATASGEERRKWKARALALQALAAGDMEEAQKVMAYANRRKR